MLLLRIAWIVYRFSFLVLNTEWMNLSHDLDLSLFPFFYFWNFPLHDPMISKQYCMRTKTKNQKIKLSYQPPP